jgi:hypothetical protein
VRPTRPRDRRFTLDTYSADVPDLDQQAPEKIGGLFLPHAAEEGT